MSGAELGLAVLATTDFCFKYCKILIEKYDTLKSAESEIKQRVLRIQSNWMKTARQLELLALVWETIDGQLQRVQDGVTEVLLEKLMSADTRIKSLQAKKSKQPDGSAKASKWKYALTKECLDKAIQDMEEWQRLFDPTWIFIMSLSNPHIDRQLARNDRGDTGPERVARKLRASLKKENPHQVFLPEKDFVEATRRAIPFSSAQTMKRAGSEKLLIVDTASLDGDTGIQIEIVTKDVRTLAKRLSQVEDFSCGLLSCRGVVRESDPANKRTTAFNFIFRCPDGLKNPRSLRKSLPTRTRTYPLPIASRLPSNWVHLFGFVHKSVRPETVLVFENEDSRMDGAFLLGFEKFRLADGRTIRLGDSDWEKDLYRHPDRQGLEPAQDFVMQHDIFSLGVYLLEIGLWESLVSYDEEGSSPRPSDIMGLLHEQSKREEKNAVSRKKVLVDLAKQRLPSRMGDKYTETVVTCLTCLDNGNTDFGDRSEFEDEDGVLVGVRYIEKRFNVTGTGERSESQF
ncbi:hypothetical protein H2200_009610 [Cladophialophora chaetospira]|uniref:Protein kinase domain-containing protein n=1 Tax=Cladophialophora chaetospira TaxID=386627 RepID=A0AA38X2R8_9EURO|nr:hypothetical protein H2200_009610 [Cladophialophora chaetospira]